MASQSGRFAFPGREASNRMFIKIRGRPAPRREFPRSLRLLHGTIITGVISALRVALASPPSFLRRLPYKGPSTLATDPVRRATDGSSGSGREMEYRL